MKYLGKLHEMTERFPQTNVWNDSCALEELQYALDRGAVGATTNPVIILQVLEKEADIWHAPLMEIIKTESSACEDDIACMLIEQIVRERSRLLLPIFKNSGGKVGRLSVQTNPKIFRNAERMIEEAVRLNSIAPNIQVKIPGNEEGLRAIEESTFLGVNVNATAVFTISQMLAVAEAIERGLRRREQRGLTTKDMSPVCTLMIGRVDDWIKEYAKRRGILANPEYMEWAGVAIFKKAYRIFCQRKYRTRILTAGMRNYYHWSALIGADCSMTISYEWQKRINESAIDIVCNYEKPVESRFLSELMKLDAFVRSYSQDGYTPNEFSEIPMFKITLLSFLSGYDELVRKIRQMMFYGESGA